MRFVVLAACGELRAACCVRLAPPPHPPCRSSRFVWGLGRAFGQLRKATYRFRLLVVYSGFFFLLRGGGVGDPHGTNLVVAVSAV